MDKSSGWIKKHPDEIIGALGSDINQGLSDKDAINRRNKFGKNDLWYIGHPLMFLRHESGFSAIGYIVMIISALSAAAFNKCSDSTFVVLSLIAGVAISLFFYIYSGILCRNNTSKWIPVCSVVRSGKLIKLRGDSVVPGDIIILSEGDFVCADIKIIEADEFFIKDVTLGKKDNAVQKFAVSGSLAVDGQASSVNDYVYAGSRVVSGKAKAIVCATGSKTFIGDKGKIRLVPDREPTTISAMRKLGFTSGTFAMIFSFAAVAIGVFSPAASVDFIGLFLVFLAFAVSSCGEILPSLACFMFAFSMNKCMESGVLIRDFSALDIMRTLDGVVFENSTMLKTGESTLKSVWVSGKSVEIGDTEGDELLSVLLAGTDYGKGKYGIEVSAAITDYFENRGDPDRFINGIKTTKTVLEHRKVGTSQYSLYASGGEHYFTITGAIDEVIANCSKIEINGSAVPIDKYNLSDVLSAAAEASKVATVLIAVAARKSPYNSMKRLSVLASDLTFIGFIAVDTPADPVFVSDLSYLKREKIPFVFFTDGSGEDVNFARKCGIIRDRNEMLPADDPDGTVGVLFAEKSTGGIVSITEDTNVTDFLLSAKKAGKKIVFVGDQNIIKGSALCINPTFPAAGSGAFIMNSDAGCGVNVLETIKSLRAIFNRFGIVRRFLTVSAIVRGVFALTAAFGMPFVFPSIVLAWGFIVDVAIAVGILVLKHK